MISASVKYLEGAKWLTLDLKEVVGMSILEWMKSTEKRAVAALLEDGVPRIFVCNRQADWKIYSKKGFACSPEELALFVERPIPPFVAGLFPDGTFEKLEKERSHADKNGSAGEVGEGP